MFTSSTANLDVGSVINNFHFDRVKAMIDEDHKGTVLIGSKDYNRERNQIPPTIIENPSLDSTMMKDEIFGPILPLFKYKNFQDVVDFINNNDKPLAIY